MCILLYRPASKGLRESLYLEDDDSRLSFLFGNYVTLTNLTEHEINRIIKMHISPINVPVHTTNPSLGENDEQPLAGEAPSVTGTLCSMRASTLTASWCYARAYNDGPELERTLSDLYTLGAPGPERSPCVPVGVTRYREGLYLLMRSFTRETAGATLRLIEAFGDRCLKEHGARVVYAG